MENFVFSTELFPGLPEEVGLECLSRLPYTAHRVASRVCHRWRDLLQSPYFYYHRKKLGYTHKVACLVLPFNGPKKPDVCVSSSYGIAVFDSVSQSWDRLPPVPKYPNGLPLFCQIASCGGKLVVVMGGWNPLSHDSVSDVFIYDFMTQQWKQSKDMPSKRSFFGIGACSGRIFIAGGEDENKNALRTAWVYDMRKDEWTQLGELSQGRVECEGVVIGEDEFWVVSGYETGSQNRFDGSADIYGLKSGQWRRVEEVWEPGRCPRSCVGIGKDGELLNWMELNPALQFPVCGVDLGGRVFVTGSEHCGGPRGFYMVDMKEGQNSKLQKFNKPDELKELNMAGEYYWFAQKVCSAEI